MENENVSAVITGTSRGIGLELVKWFLAHTPHKVIAITRKKSEKLNMIQNSKLIVSEFDINSSEEEYHKWVQDLKKQSIVPKFLINNSGILINKPISALTEFDFIAQLQVNLIAVFKLMKHLSIIMPPHSHIVNIGSMGGYQGSSKFPGLSQYSASKGAVAILTECFAEELKSRQISVNCLALGAVDTEMLNEAFPEYISGMKPEKMATFIGDFTLNGHQFFNGKVLPVSVSTP